MFKEHGFKYPVISKEGLNIRDKYSSTKTYIPEINTLRNFI